MPRWYRRRHGEKKVGRPPKPILVNSLPFIKRLEPSPKKNIKPIYLEPAEVEALRLIDLEKLSFVEAGAKLRVSRNTAWRLVESAREKLIRAIIQGREVVIIRNA